MSDGGKGDTQRPKSVDAETFASNWNNIFSKKNAAIAMPGTIGSAKIVFTEDEKTTDLPNDSTQGG